MKKMKKILFIVLMYCGAAQLATAQSEELFTYGQNKAYLDEFSRQFFKNNPQESITRDTAKYYLNLFVNFKLKVQQAKDLGMDTAPDFVAEMAQYRKQLAQPYMVDTTATESLIKEAYENMKSEVKASHIMVALSYDALPKDTLVAWNRAIELKNKLKNESFDSVAKKYSEDQSAKTNLGSLGYFTAFDMIYPFELAAYTTRVGDIYGPFRTQFGYHILKVWDKRAARPKMRIAHIMLRLSAEPADDEILRVKQKADSISAEIKKGRTFEEMVKEYSDDGNTRNNGGEIGLLESTNRSFPEEFRETAFGLKNDGDISVPIKTPFGWHIIKRLGTEELKPLDTLYNDIKRKISNPRDERYGLTRQAVINRIKKEYAFAENPQTLQNFILRTDSSVLRGSWKQSANAADPFATQVMFTLGDAKYTTADFSAFIEINQQPVPNGDIRMTVENLYKSFVEQRVWEYEEAHLGNKHPKYRFLVQEYHDGILLFNLSEKRVWNKGVTDSIGLQAYYDANKHRYMWGERLDAVIYECDSEEVCTKVKKWVKKGYADTTISRMAHEIHPLSLAIKTGKYQKGDHPVLSAIKWKKGKYKVEKDGKHYFVVVKKALPAQPKALSEVRGPLTSEYQTTLEKQWIEDLKKEYPVTINQVTFDKFLNTLPR